MAEVVTTGAAREALHQIAKGFDAGLTEPVYFGSHRRAQGVIVPVEVWEKLLEAAEDDVDLALAAQRSTGPDASTLDRPALTQADLDQALAGAAAAADPSA